MTSSKGSAEDFSSSQSARDSGDESEDSSEECEVLEYSPCGRWQKRREEVHQRDVPGIDSAFLAMDNDQGIEVVWNEVCISEKKSCKSTDVPEVPEKIKTVFDNLIQIEHANIVKFHQYWADQRRVIFITEFVSSGSLKQFLKKTKKNNKTLKAWKRWCTQILSALSYLHSFPIIHGNLRTDTIFIQHNGLIKIGTVAPDAIYDVKTYRQEMKNLHYYAPEYESYKDVSTAVDIYSFGICALEMAALEIVGNGDSGKVVSQECIEKTLESIEDPLQKDFIRKCLTSDPKQRPSARELLFHEVLFEVPSLKLQAAHSLVRNVTYLEVAENTADEVAHIDPQRIVATISHQNGREHSNTLMSQVPKLELEKFLEDVKNGVYPLTAFPLNFPRPQTRVSAKSPEILQAEKADTPETFEVETRTALAMDCKVKKLDTTPGTYHMTILLRMADQMNRRLSCDFLDGETCTLLAQELVEFGFISKQDEEKLSHLMEENLTKTRLLTSSPPHIVDQKA